MDHGCHGVPKCTTKDNKGILSNYAIISNYLPQKQGLGPFRCPQQKGVGEGLLNLLTMVVQHPRQRGVAPSWQRSDFPRSPKARSAMGGTVSGYGCP